MIKVSERGFKVSVKQCTVKIVRHCQSLVEFELRHQGQNTLQTLGALSRHLSYLVYDMSWYAKQGPLLETVLKCRVIILSTTLLSTTLLS